MIRNGKELVLTDKYGDPPEFERSHSYDGYLRPAAHDLASREAAKAFRDRKLQAAQAICEQTIFAVDPSDTEIVIFA